MVLNLVGLQLFGDVHLKHLLETEKSPGSETKTSFHMHRYLYTRMLMPMCIYHHYMLGSMTVIHMKDKEIQL